MKCWKTQLGIFTTLLIAGPAFAQSNQQTADEGAGILVWIVDGLPGG